MKMANYTVIIVDQKCKIACMHALICIWIKRYYNNNNNDKPVQCMNIMHLVSKVN